VGTATSLIQKTLAMVPCQVCLRTGEACEVSGHGRSLSHHGLENLEQVAAAGMEAVEFNAELVRLDARTAKPQAKVFSCALDLWTMGGRGFPSLTPTYQNTTSNKAKVMMPNGIMAATPPAISGMIMDEQ